MIGLGTFSEEAWANSRWISWRSRCISQLLRQVFAGILLSNTISGYCSPFSFFRCTTSSVLHLSSILWHSTHQIICQVKMSEKAANVQRNTLKDLQKAWRTTAQDHLKRLQESRAPLKQNIKKMGGSLRVCPSTLDSKYDLKSFEIWTSLIFQSLHFGQVSANQKL